MLPNITPVALNTTSLDIVFPEMAQKWPNKGVYVSIEGASLFPNIYFRAGRLELSLSL